MTESELLRAIESKRSPDHRIIRFSRKENDFADYELIERFLDNLTGDEEIGYVELLTMDDLLNIVKRVSGDKVRVLHTDTGDSVEWTHKGKGGLTKQVCSFSPENLLNILDVESRGNPIKQ